MNSLCSTIAHGTAVRKQQYLPRKRELSANAATAITLGNYLYIDGGELSTWDGKGDGYWNPNDMTSHVISRPGT